MLDVCLCMRRFRFWGSHEQLLDLDPPELEKLLHQQFATRLTRLHAFKLHTEVSNAI